ncbi:MarR family winged helix-turn-helix transcriptional regulator [Streptomyces sp. NPDC048405]|uniref:MarR family winged helix-turn-helix transcriptional regulator n=1 Tax=unclassified Streptomyces TaxID=2593676 RepID=UPI00371B0874|nr:MarR family transcriptional regulator [Streptomyces sp. NBC_01124]
MDTREAKGADACGDDGQSRPPSLLELPSYLISHVSRIGHDVLISAVAEADLRLPHFAALTALADFGSLPQHELADRLGLNRSHLVGYLDTVEGRGYVRRTRDPADRRRQLVALTPEGERLQRHLFEVAQRSQDQFLGCLTPDERATLSDLLRRVLAAGDRASGDPASEDPVSGDPAP